MLNFFAIGDAAVRTNPLYGRGCSVGFVSAHVLRAALDSSRSPIERAKMFDREIENVVRPYFDSMVELDLNAIRRARHERDPAYRPSLRARMTRSFAQDGLMPAQRGDVEVSRAMSRVFHMLDEPSAILTRPAILARIMRVWAMSEAEKRRRGYYAPKAGPDRAGMLKLLKIAA